MPNLLMAQLCIFQRVVNNIQKRELKCFLKGKYILNNFRSLIEYGVPVRLNLLKQDKGHSEEIMNFIEVVKGNSLLNKF